MKRQTVLLSVLAAVLVVAAYWLLLFQPQREELADVRAQVALQETHQADLKNQLVRLREVRSRAPEIEAELVAAAAVIPPDEALPGLLRQLQTAADDASVILQAVTTSRPTAVEAVVPPTSSIDLSIQLEGNYFQLVDFLRRIEDPAITPRGLQWQSASLVRAEYPTLNVSLGARVFAQLPVAEEPAATDEATPDPAVNEEESDLAADAAEGSTS